MLVEETRCDYEMSGRDTSYFSINGLRFSFSFSAW